MLLDWNKIPTNVAHPLKHILEQDNNATLALNAATPATLRTTLGSILEWHLDMKAINHSQKDAVIAYFTNTPPEDYELDPIPAETPTQLVERESREYSLSQIESELHFRSKTLCDPRSNAETRQCMIRDIKNLLVQIEEIPVAQ